MSDRRAPRPCIIRLERTVVSDLAELAQLTGFNYGAILSEALRKFRGGCLDVKASDLGPEPEIKAFRVPQYLDIAPDKLALLDHYARVLEVHRDRVAGALLKAAIRDKVIKWELFCA